MQGARALWLGGDSGLLRPADGSEWLAEGLLADHIVDSAPTGFGRTGRDGRHQYVWFPIGHLYLMVPFVALGERLERAWPAVEATYRARSPDFYHEGQFAIEQGLIALVLAPAVGASIVLLLFAIAREFGCGRREALLVPF